MKLRQIGGRKAIGVRATHVILVAQNEFNGIFFLKIMVQPIKQPIKPILSH